MARKKAEKLVEGLKKGKKWKPLLYENKLRVEETGFFRRRNSIIPKIGYSEEVKEYAFSLSPNNPYAKKVFQVNDTYFIVKLKTKKGMDKEQFKLVKDRFKKVLIEQKKEEIFQAWMNHLKTRAEIVRDLSPTR